LDNLCDLKRDNGIVKKPVKAIGVIELESAFEYLISLC
jgi:hypothetical protein